MRLAKSPYEYRLLILPIDLSSAEIQYSGIVALNTTVFYRMTLFYFVLGIQIASSYLCPLQPTSKTYVGVY